MLYLTSPNYRQSLQQIAESGALVEEIISTVRTMHAFDSQTMLGSPFDKKMDKTCLMGGKSAIWSGCVIAVFMFVIQVLRLPSAISVHLSCVADAGK